jgi:hypothetical protein
MGNLAACEYNFSPPYTVNYVQQLFRKDSIEKLLNF